MAYIFGQHLYSERRYSWIDEWSAQVPPPDVWFKSGCLPGAWDVRVCEPGVWQPVICGPVPPLDPPAPPLTAIQGRIRGEIRPIGSLHAKVDPPDAIAGHITGSVIPVGSLQGTVTLPVVQGTITGVLRPVGSIHASQASDWVGILPQFGPVHHTSMTVSTITNPNDRIKVNFGQGTGQSLDRLPGGKVVWKTRVVQASGVDSRLGMSEELAPGASELAYPPGFAMQGVTLNQDGGVYDGFPRPGTGVTFGTGSYILHGRDSAEGKWWIGTTDADGTNVVWHGDPLAGTGEAWKFPDPATHAAVFGSSGDIFEFVPTVASEIPGREPLGIHGVVHPVGSLHGVAAVPTVTGTITGVVRPVGSLQGAVSSGAPTTISARYWSINITAKVGTEAGVSELEFAKLGAAKYAGGTASATSTFSGFPASNVIDGNTSTAWVAASSALPQRLSVDFGSAVDVNVVRVKGRSGTVYPTTFTVDYSSDGSTWTTGWTVTGADDSTYTDTPLPYPNPAATGGLKPLWRINVTATESGTLAVNEVEMRGSVGGADLTGSGRPWCRDTGFGLPVSNAFDNNIATTYHGSGALAGGIIGYEFPNSVSALELYIYPRSGTPAQAPKNFTLQYSANGVSWTTAMSPAAQTGWTAAVPRTFT